MGLPFFFEQTNTGLSKKYPNVFKGGQRNENRHAQKHWEIVEPYGWLNTLYDVAKTGLFTTPNDNAIDSVRNTNLYVIFTFISWKSAQNEYENAVRKGMEDEAKQKANAMKARKR